LSLRGYEFGITGLLEALQKTAKAHNLRRQPAQHIRDPLIECP
jgi:hypothetical protein